MPDIKSDLSLHISNYLARLRLERKSETTQMSYRGKLYEFEEILIENKGKDFKTKELSHRDLQQYLDTLSTDKDDEFIKNGRGNKPSSVANKFIIVRTFCRYLYIEEVIDEDITIVPRGGRFRLPEVEKRKPRALSIEEYQQMLRNITWVEGEKNVYNGKFISLRNKAMVSMLLTAGLRRFELLNLTRDNIKGDTITLVGKGNKERTVPLHPATKESLEDWLEALEKRTEKNDYEDFDTDLIFPSNRGGVISDGVYWEIINRAFSTIGRGRYIANEFGEDILDKNGEKTLNKDRLTPHATRKTATSVMHKQGVELGTIAEILGHSDIKTTQIYVDIDEGQKQRAVNLIPMD